MPTLKCHHCGYGSGWHPDDCPVKQASDHRARELEHWRTVERSIQTETRRNDHLRQIDELAERLDVAERMVAAQKEVLSKLLTADTGEFIAISQSLLMIPRPVPEHVRAHLAPILRKVIAHVDYLQELEKSLR